MVVNPAIGSRKDCQKKKAFFILTTNQAIGGWIGPGVTISDRLETNDQIGWGGEILSYF